MAAVVQSSEKIGQKLAPFNPSHASVVDAALRLLALGADDTFFDLGCGDGRLLVAAAERCGARAVGFEFDRKWVAAARAAAAAKGLLDGDGDAADGGAAGGGARSRRSRSVRMTRCRPRFHRAAACERRWASISCAGLE